MITEKHQNEHGLYWVIHHIRKEEEGLIEKTMDDLATPKKNSDAPDYSNLPSICSMRSNK